MGRSKAREYVIRNRYGLVSSGVRQAVMQGDLEIAANRLIDNEPPVQRFPSDEEGDVLGERRNEIPTVEHGIHREVRKQVIGSHASDGKTRQVSLNRAPPDFLRVVLVPNLRHEVQQQRMVGMVVGGIAVDVGQIPQLSDDAVDGRQVLLADQQVDICQRSRSPDAVEARKDVSALEEEEVDPTCAELCQHDSELLEGAVACETDL